MTHQLPHKYEKRDIGINKKYLVQACALNCTHYLTIKASVGKASICWKCEKPFVLTKASSRLSKPRCLSCKERRKPELKNVDKTALQDILAKMGLK